MDRTPKAAIAAVANKLGVDGEVLDVQPSELSDNFWRVTDTNTGEIYLYGVRAGLLLPGNTIRAR